MHEGRILLLALHEQSLSVDSVGLCGLGARNTASDKDSGF